MSAPFPSELTAAPRGGRIAWVFDACGARNIWVTGPPDYKARAVTDYPDDDGQEIGELAWTSDSKSIVYARGGDFEMMREYPNPRSFIQGVEQDVWAVSLDGEKPRKLGEGHSPAVSPRGDRVVFVYKDQIWSAKIDGSEKASQLIHALGKASVLRWSPDGSKLAFRSTRGDHSFIGVYDFGSQALRYLDPSVDRDTQEVWSPDGKQIAFIRLPAAAGEVPFSPRRRGRPWSIRLVDSTTGAGREVWKADEGTGSVFRDIPGNHALLWGAGDHLVFPWEKEGWLHLYSVPVAGGKAQLLTPGEFEVEHVSLSPDRKEVLFSSNQDDIDRRHLWKVAVAGGRPTALTRGEGLEWSPVEASDGKTVAYLGSGARRPAHAALLLPSGKTQDLAPETLPADFPESSLVAPQPVIISAADGLMIHGQVFLPRSSQPGDKHPAVIFFHGGSRRQMLLGWHYMGYYHNAYAMNQYLASRGYVVLSVNYRSGIGYGLEFREALNYGAAGASEFEDVMGAGLYLRGRPDVDPSRIGLWGGSYGGYLTALGLARASSLFAAGVDMHGVHDWNPVMRNFAPEYDPEKRQEAARLAFASSPLASVSTWRSPVLLIHGDDDRNVPFNQTVRLVEALRKQGVPVKELIFPDEIHDFLLHASWLAAYHATADFFDRQLR